MGGVKTGLVWKWKFSGWEGDGMEKRKMKRVEDVHVRMKESEKKGDDNLFRNMKNSTCVLMPVTLWKWRMES